MANNTSPVNESDSIELKGEHDPQDQGHKLQLIKEIVAMANAGGGQIHLGVAEHGGQRPGLDDNVIAALDPARLSDSVDRYVVPDHVSLTCHTESCDHAERRVVVVRVEPHAAPPLVFAKPGEYQRTGAKLMSVFTRHAVYKRKGTQAAPATRQDYKDWTEAAVARERELWRSRVQLVAELPADAHLSIAAGEGETSDEPAALLARAVGAWRADSSKMLTRQELAVLFLSRNSLAEGDPEVDLIIHSALRRKATLWFWLDRFAPTSDRLHSILGDAVEGNDRDKSDAGRSIVEVASLYLSNDLYRQVVRSLAISRYAHFREAAEEGRKRSDVLRRLRSSIPAALRDEATPRLIDQAEDLARELIQRSRAALSRRFALLGLVTLTRSNPAIAERLGYSPR